MAASVIEIAMRTGTIWRSCQWRTLWLGLLGSFDWVTHVVSVVGALIKTQSNACSSLSEDDSPAGLTSRTWRTKNVRRSTKQTRAVVSLPILAWLWKLRKWYSTIAENGFGYSSITGYSYCTMLQYSTLRRWTRRGLRTQMRWPTPHASCTVCVVDSMTGTRLITIDHKIITVDYTK